MALRLLIALLILVVPLELPGCGPFFEATEFNVGLEPEVPDQFVRGTLGILQPSYARLYQVIAYRYLMGAGLNDAERQAVLPPAPAVNSASVSGPPVNDSPPEPEAERSEEHTSELQSPDHLVCRLLLEKKKKNKYNIQICTQRP